MSSIMERKGKAPMPDVDDDTGAATPSGPPALNSFHSFHRPVLREEALYGLAGEVVRGIEPHSEADPAALLLHFLTMFGNAVGNGPYVRLGPDEHPARLFTVIVGDAATARKGTAGSEIKRLMKDADAEWFNRAIEKGLQSSEAIATAVDDNIGETNELMIFYSEFGGLLDAINMRNSISDTMKDAYDGQTLKVRTKIRSGWRTASHAHISVIGHVTPTILADRLSDAEIASGFANRLLFAIVDRSKLLSRPTAIDEDGWDKLANKVDAALTWIKDWTFEGVDPISNALYHHFSRSPKREMHLTEAAWDLWDTLYAELNEKRSGVVGDLTGRASTNVIRLAVTYAIADRSPTVGVKHLEAAKAVWDYCEASIEQIFAGVTGDYYVDKILKHLENATDRTLTKSEIWAIFSRNHNASWINNVVDRLLGTTLVTKTVHQTGGRPVTTFTLRNETNEKSSVLVAGPQESEIANEDR